MTCHFCDKWEPRKVKLIVNGSSVYVCEKCWKKEMKKRETEAKAKWKIL